MVREVLAVQQLDFTEIWERAALRLAIIENLATVFGEVPLDDACRCQCGWKVWCVVNPNTGCAIIWCDRCGWYADERWLVSGAEDGEAITEANDAE